MAARATYRVSAEISVEIELEDGDELDLNAMLKHLPELQEALEKLTMVTSVRLHDEGDLEEV